MMDPPAAIPTSAGRFCRTMSASPLGEAGSLVPIGSPSQGYPAPVASAATRPRRWSGRRSRSTRWKEDYNHQASPAAEEAVMPSRSRTAHPGLVFPRRAGSFRARPRLTPPILPTALVVLTCLGAAIPSGAAAALDPRTAADGLKEALGVGTGRSVDVLGRPDGYLMNLDVKIPMPDKLRTVDKSLRTIGKGRLVDEFVTSMNRAAEAAA